MFAIKKLCLFFIISQISQSTSEQNEQEKFTQQYHNIIRQSLSKVSTVFDGIEYNIKDGKFQMKWIHGNEPTLDFSFDVIFQNESVCHLEFVIDSYLAHVPEKMRFDVNSAQINEIIQSTQACAEKIEQKITGPSEINYDNQIMSQGQDLIKKDKSLSEEQIREIERVVFLNESDKVQQHIVRNPRSTINKMKVINQYVDNEDISSQEKENIKEQVLSDNQNVQDREYPDTYSDTFESYHESSEESNKTKQSSKDVDVGFTNDDDMPTYSDGNFSQGEQESDQSGFSDESNTSSKRRSDIILNDILNQMNQVDFSEDEPIVNQTDNSEEIDQKYINKVNTNSNSHESLEKSQKQSSDMSSSQESKIKPNIQVANLDEDVLSVDSNTEKQDYTCSVLDKALIKEKMKFLILQNYIQDVKVFNENIIKCKKQERVRMNAILSFNRELCFIGLDGTFEKGYKMLNHSDKGTFGIPLEDDMMNCIDRFGTVLLKTF